MRTVKIILTLFCVVASIANGYAWSGEGHATIGHIADRNLTPKARKMCNKYLGHSLAYHASWMDKWRYSKEYHHTARWHAVGVKEGEFVPGELAGDIAVFLAPLTMDDHGVVRLEQLLNELKDYRNMPDSAVAVNLKCIIHMVGDMHCPGHIFFHDQKQFVMKEKGENLRFHGLIDRAYRRFNKKMSSDEFYEKHCNISKKEIKALMQGNMAEWIEQNIPLFRECYTLCSPDVDYADIPNEKKMRLKEITDNLCRDGGFRLAYIINEIFR